MPDSSLDTEAVDAAENLQDVNSDSSTETDTDQGVPSLEDAVSAVLDDQSDDEAAPASEEPGPKEPDSEAQASEEEAPAEDELSEEEKKHFSERAQNRFRELVGQRKEAEGKLTELQQQFDEVKPKAEQMDQLTSYMQQHEISPDHLNNALGLTSLINGGQYDQAIPVLENLLGEVRRRAGDVLPPDLQQRVSLGYISEEDAKALNRARVSEQNTRDRSEKERQRAEQQRQQDAVQQAVTTAVGTADAWAKEQAQSDPDWNLKRDLVTQRMELELRRLGPEGYPRTPEKVRELLGQIKQEVETGLKKFRPAPKPIQSVNGGSVSPRSQAKPESLMDAVDAALGG